MRIDLTTALAALLLAGCAAEATVYRPLTPNLVQVDGKEAATYPVPPAAPKGEVCVVSFGGEKLSGPGDEVLYLHLRLWAHNDGDEETWTADAGEQILEYLGRGSVRAAFARGENGQPRIAVRPGTRAALDLYFLLPPDADPPRATLWWNLRRADGTISQTTTFERVSGRYEEPYPGFRVGFGVGFGPLWWGPGAFWSYPWGYPYWGFGAPIVVPPAWRRVPVWPRGQHGPLPPPVPQGKSDWRGGHR